MVAPGPARNSTGDRVLGQPLESTTTEGIAFSKDALERVMKPLDEIGKLVRLKGGGPVMTVKEVRPMASTSQGDILLCRWFVGAELYEHSFIRFLLDEVEMTEVQRAEKQVAESYKPHYEEPLVDPMEAAFKTYKETDEYTSAVSFAVDPDFENRETAMKIVFSGGWRMAFAPRPVAE